MDPKSKNLTGKIRPSHVADTVPSWIGAKVPLIESEQALINPELDRWAADAKHILAHRCFSAEQRQAIRQFLTEVGRWGGRSKSTKKTAASRLNGASRWKGHNADPQKG
jgi:hypothetical protein